MTFWSKANADLRGEPFATRRARLESLGRAARRARASICRRCVPFADLGGAGGGARRSRRCGRRPRCRSGRRRDDQAARRALSAGAPEGPVVEMEARSLRGRCGADVCAARPRQAFVVLFRLHVRGVDRGRGGDELVPVGKAYFGFTDAELAEIDRFVRATPSTGSARCARSCTRTIAASSSKSRSRACSGRPATSPASRCAFRASAGCAGTSARAMPTGWRRSRPC